jgi:hypothetical protein
MERIKKEDLELMYGKMIAEKQLTILGFEDKLNFEIYDGFAYCPDYKGDEYCMKYPMIEIVNKSTEMQGVIRKYMGLEESDDISVLEILQTFNEMSKNGTRIEYVEDLGEVREKCMWK